MWLSYRFSLESKEKTDKWSTRTEQHSISSQFSTRESLGFTLPYDVKKFCGFQTLLEINTCCCLESLNMVEQRVERKGVSNGQLRKKVSFSLLKAEERFLFELPSRAHVPLRFWQQEFFILLYPNPHTSYTSVYTLWQLNARGKQNKMPLTHQNSLTLYSKSARRHCTGNERNLNAHAANLPLKGIEEFRIQLCLLPSTIFK